MSLLSVTVKKARFVGAQTAQWNCYATLKLQHVKSTTVTVKGANPSWEQDFLFEINNLDTGLLVEVWNKGLIWDKAVGYHWLHLRDIHYSNFCGAGQWLSLEAEQVMRDGEVVGTKTPTGHSLLVDARFELPLGAVEGEEGVELQRKLEILNSMLDKEARAEHSRRQHQYYIQSGVSEDSDYTSDVNFPVGQHPNSSASQYLSASNQLTTPQRSLNSSRENSYEKDDEYRTGNQQNHSPYGAQPHYPTTTRTTPRRLPQPQTQPRPPQQQQLQQSTTNMYWDEGLPPTSGVRDTETEPLYYNSRPQSNYKSYGRYRRRDYGSSDEYGYDDDLSYSRGRQYGDNYENAQENYPATGTHIYNAKRQSRREMPVLERQDTLYSESGLPGDYANNGSHSYPTIPTTSNSTYVSPRTHSAQHSHDDYYSSTQSTSTIGGYNHSAQQQYGGEYGTNGHGHGTMYDTVDSAPSSKHAHPVQAVGLQKNYPYEEWNHIDDSRDQQLYDSSATIIATPSKQPQFISPEYNKTGFQKSKSEPPISAVAATGASVPASSAPTVPDHYYPAASQAYPSISVDESMYDASEEQSAYYSEYTAADTANQSQDYGSVDETGYDNWDYMAGYYDETGTFIPYESTGQNYFDEAGNLVIVETEADTTATHTQAAAATGGADQTQYDDYYGQQGHYNEHDSMDYYWTGEDGQEYYDDQSAYAQAQPTSKASDTQSSKAKTPALQSRQPSVEYNYAYQSSLENLSPVVERSKNATGKSAPTPQVPTSTGLDRLNSISRRASFRRQTSTRDYGLDGGPDNKKASAYGPGPVPKPVNGTGPGAKVNDKLGSMDMGYSMEESGHYTGNEWKNQSQDYVDAEDGHGQGYDHQHHLDSFDQYEDAQMHHGGENGQQDGPVHMDSLDSTTSDPAVLRDPEANEKFEAQYWQKQRERIASQSTLLSQPSEDNYNYEPTYPANGQRQQMDQNQNAGPLSPPHATQPGQGFQETLSTLARSRQGSLEEQWPEEADEVWLDSRHGSVRSRKDSMAASALIRQETLESHPEEDAEYLIGDEDGQIPIRIRKQSTMSVDSQGEPLPPTTPPPGGNGTKTSSMDDESINERKTSLDVPGKEKGKTVSFDDEPPKVCAERQTKGMTSKEKWLWSMNRICSQLQVSTMFSTYYV